MFGVTLQDFLRDRGGNDRVAVSSGGDGQLPTGQAVMHRLVDVELLDLTAVDKLIFDVSLLRGNAVQLGDLTNLSSQGFLLCLLIPLAIQFFITLGFFFARLFGFFAAFVDRVFLTCALQVFLALFLFVGFFRLLLVGQSGGEQ